MVVKKKKKKKEAILKDVWVKTYICSFLHKTSAETIGLRN
jgi:hypothetical protein